jgi:hypothetical protein
MAFPLRMMPTIDIGELAYSFRHALVAEEYEWCALLQAEVNRRIDEGDPDMHAAIEYMREPGLGWQVNWRGLNGLFDRLRDVYPEEFEPWAPLLYGAQQIVKYHWLYAKEAD